MPRRPASPAAPLPAPSGLDRLGSSWVIGLVLAHAAFFTWIGFLKYRYFLFRDFDLAIFAQATDGILGGTLFSSIRGMPWLGDHSSLVLFAVAPIYAVVRHPVTLIAVQALALAAGAIPIARLARREIGGGLVPIAAAGIYLVQPALANLDLFEFHPETVCVAPLLAAFVAVREGRARATFGWAALALLGKEDAALVVGMLGLYVLARRGSWRVALGLAGLAAFSLALSFGVLKPLLASGQAQYGMMYRAWGATLPEVALNVLRHPLRALSWLVMTPGNRADTLLKLLWYGQMLGPLALVPLAAPGVMLVALPVVFEHMLSSRMPQHSIAFQYTALILPWGAAAFVVGAGAIVRRLGGRRAAMVVVLGAALAAGIASQVVFGPFGGVGPQRFRGLERPEDPFPDADARTLVAAREGLLARVPKTGGVVAGIEMLSHLTRRHDVHFLWHVMSGTYSYSTKPYPSPTRVAAVIGDFANSGIVEEFSPRFGPAWRGFLARNHLVPVASVNDEVLMLAGAPDSIELCAPALAPPALAHVARFDDQLEFVGCDPPPAGARRGGTLELRTYWRRPGGIDREFLTEIAIIDEDGDAVVQRLRPLGYTFAPPESWPDSTVVRETYRLALPVDLLPGRFEVVVRPWSRRYGDASPAATDDAAARAQNGFLKVGEIELP